MCQVNTDPMRSRQGYLQVVGKCICLGDTWDEGYNVRIIKFPKNCIVKKANVRVQKHLLLKKN